LVAGPLELNHVLLGRAKAFDGQEKAALANKCVLPIEIRIKDKALKHVACGAYHCGTITSMSYSLSLSLTYFYLFNS